MAQKNPRRIKREARIDANIFQAGMSLTRALQDMKRGTNTLSDQARRNLGEIEWKTATLRELNRTSSVDTK